MSSKDWNEALEEVEKMMSEGQAPYPPLKTTSENVCI
jgi:hypothetical protein